LYTPELPPTRESTLLPSVAKFNMRSRKPVDDNKLVGRMAGVNSFQLGSDRVAFSGHQCIVPLCMSRDFDASILNIVSINYSHS